MFGANALKPTASLKRKEVRTVSQPIPTRPATASHTKLPGASNGRHHGQVRTVQKPPALDDRFKMTPPVKKRPAARPKARLINAAQKRKAETPQPAPLSSDSEGDDDAVLIAEEENRRKRLRAETVANDPKRRIRDLENWNVEDTPAELDIEHSVRLTTGPHAKGFFPIFPDDADAEVLLHYPSNSAPERFRFHDERAHDGYNSIDDLRRTMEHVLKYYLPPSPAREELESPTGLSYHLSPTKKLKDLARIRALVETFNELVKDALQSGATADIIDKMPCVSLPLVERLMSQTYVRTVSPFTDLLKRYTSGSDNTYGELQPMFCSQIFKETRLTSDKVFLDLGSGVGNVVIQAALETGAECHGIESHKDWHRLAVSQAAEFRQRARLWGLSAGSVNLIEGDFLNCAPLNDILARVDVIVVNNKVFSPATNDGLKLLFLGLKEGAQVVSLQTFVSGELRDRNREDVGNMFEVITKKSFSGSVSWEADEVDYYIATKDSGRIEKILGSRR